MFEVAKDSASGSHTASEFDGLNEIQSECCRADIDVIALFLYVMAGQLFQE